MLWGRVLAKAETINRKVTVPTKYALSKVTKSSCHAALVRSFEE
jgi:hypothetical protein